MDEGTPEQQATLELIECAMQNIPTHPYIATQVLSNLVEALVRLKPTIDRKDYAHIVSAAAIVMIGAVAEQQRAYDEAGPAPSRAKMN